MLFLRLVIWLLLDFFFNLFVQGYLHISKTYLLTSDVEHNVTCLCEIRLGRQ